MRPGQISMVSRALASFMGAMFIHDWASGFARENDMEALVSSLLFVEITLGGFLMLALAVGVVLTLYELMRGIWQQSLQRKAK